jgi:hypothetical protein
VVGFHDDPSYRWVPERMPRIQRSADDGATIVRLLVQWNLVAPRRPSAPADPFDPAYGFDDVDEAIRAAQKHGQEAMLTISGTPRWAGGGKPNRMPRNVSDFRLLYAAAYAGIRSGNRLAKVAIGETSARGRDRRVPGVSDTHSPGRFAELVAKANPRLTFDAWAHHPYPFNPNSRPGQIVRVAERLARVASALPQKPR